MPHPVQSVCIVRLYRFQRKLLLPVEVQRYLAQVIVFEVERITFQMTVERSIVHESDHEASGQLTGKQFLVTDVPIVLRQPLPPFPNPQGRGSALSTSDASCARMRAQCPSVLTF